MKSDPNCGAMGAGAGGGNRVASAHISKQHANADSKSMLNKTSSNGVSSKVKPHNAPSDAGSITAGKTGKRSFSRILD